MLRDADKHDELRLVQLGNSGLEVPEVSIGTALTVGTENMSRNFARKFFRRCYELGFRSFDTSDNYGFGMAETLLGLSLQRFRRQDLLISSKGSWPLLTSSLAKGLSRRHLNTALSSSLERLGLSSLDLYYAHRPDPLVTVQEVVKTFNFFIQRGLISYWGVSEWPIEKVREAVTFARNSGLEGPVVNQVCLSYLIDSPLKSGLIRSCSDLGVGTIGYAPLAQGILTGKYTHAIPPKSRIGKGQTLRYDKTEKILKANRARLDGFVSIGQKFDVELENLALGWLKNHGIPVVIGASGVRQLEQIRASIDIPLPTRVFDELEYLRQST